MRAPEIWRRPPGKLRVTYAKWGNEVPPEPEPEAEGLGFEPEKHTASLNMTSLCTIEVPTTEN